MKKVTVVGLVLLFVAANGAMARVITLDASRDSILMSTDSNKGNHGNNYTDSGGSRILMGWDLSGVSLAAGEYVASGTVRLYSSSGGSNYNFDVDCYPLVKTWVEGVGTDGSYGGTGWPWGPVSIGDATWTYQIVNSRVADANYTYVADGGTAWAGAGASGTTGASKDCDGARQMVDALLSGSAGDGDVAGNLPLTAAGCAVAEDWIDGDLTNNGLVMVLTYTEGNSVIHVGTRERGCASAANAPGAYAPELELEILPEPGCLALLGLGAIGLLRRKRK